jgi:hypothetical protein
MTTKVAPADNYDATQGQTIVIPDRVDEILLADYLVKTVLPTEELRVGYAVLPKIVYMIWERFGDLAKPLIPTILAELQKAGLISEAPFPNCYKRRVGRPARDRA